MIEHRKSVRHDVNIDATLAVDEQQHQSAILNLSVGGALVQFEDRLPPDKRVTIHFRIPTHEKEISVGATVRWTGEGAIGIQFDGLRAKEVWALNKYFDSLPR